MANRCGWPDAQRLRARRRAHCTLPVVDDQSRRRTLLTLIALAEGHNPADCWDDRRAEELLRKESNPEELRALGMDERMIAYIFAGNDGR